MKLRYLWLCVTATAVTGCSTASKMPPVIEKPVPITCQTPRPAEPIYPVINNDDGLFVRTQKQLEIDHLQKGYIEQLKAWGEGCQTPSK